MERILVSACLLGLPVRYHGGDAAVHNRLLDRWRAEGRLVAVCPEQDGGLSTPRPPAEIVGGDGRTVVAGLAFVRTRSGADVTEPFRRGAASALDAVKRHAIRIAILKDGSPSCGSARIYDGTFSGKVAPGVGVTTALLAAHGVRVFSEHETAEAAEYLRALEQR